ncbi:MAG: class II D-tagatose-bisphosphate aldolase non-catalytic subunit [Thermodesulfobacteriota bacterium]
MPDCLREFVAAHKRDGRLGLTSVCSANRLVVEAVLVHAAKRNLTACIESTGQQVNQFGGYVGMQPRQFAEYVRQTARAAGLPNERLIPGGDHLGPEPWKHEAAETAMAKARELIRQCVLAGYRKLHLDASTACRDDVRDGRPWLSTETIAERTAALCKSAEEAAGPGPDEVNRLAYVVGTEVPPAGGHHKDHREIPASSAADMAETITLIRKAFVAKGLEPAWERCIALVAHHGAGFGPEVIWAYDSAKTAELRASIRNHANLVFEAHSTDFQTRASLAAMVQDHFAILKAGPCLTFAMREAIFALAHMEREWLGDRRGVTLSRLPEIMGNVMLAEPKHWRDHYRGGETYLRYITAYGFSDRLRYYWSHPRITEAVSLLFHNLARHGIPLPLLSQYLPAQYAAVREGRLDGTPESLVTGKIFEILDRYAAACGHSGERSRSI